MIRTSLLAPLACVVLLRQSLCSCGVDDGPCEYEVIPLEPDAQTLWGTTPAQDIAALEVPQHGTWSWSESHETLEIDNSGVSLPAWATFVHDPQTIRFSEHVGGGSGLACDGPTVAVDGILTFTDEQGEVIVSVPVTAERQWTAMVVFGADPEYSPISLFSNTVHETVEFESMQVVGAIGWWEQGLLAEFYYYAHSMRTETTGDGVITDVAKFEADEQP